MLLLTVLRTFTNINFVLEDNERTAKSEGEGDCYDPGVDRITFVVFEEGCGGYKEFSGCMR